MAITPVQSVITPNGSVINMAVTTFAAPTLSAVGSGNAIAGGFTFVAGPTNVSGAIQSITDDKSNTYNLSSIVQEVADGNWLLTFYLQNITNAPTVITVNAAATRDFQFNRFVVSEFSGVATASPLDVGFGGPTSQTSVATTVDLIKSASVTTLVDGDLIYAACIQTDAGTGMNAGSTFTNLIYGANADTVPMRGEYKIQAAHAAVTGDFTAVAAAHNYVTGMIPLKAAAVAPKCGGLGLLGVGCGISLAGLRMPLLIGGAACRVGQHIRRNATLSRRQFLSLPQERQKS